MFESSRHPQQVQPNPDELQSEILRLTVENERLRNARGKGLEFPLQIVRTTFIKTAKGIEMLSMIGENPVPPKTIQYYIQNYRKPLLNFKKPDLKCMMKRMEIHTLIRFYYVSQMAMENDDALLCKLFPPLSKFIIQAFKDAIGYDRSGLYSSLTRQPPFSKSELFDRVEEFARVEDDLKARILRSAIQRLVDDKKLDEFIQKAEQVKFAEHMVIRARHARLDSISNNQRKFEKKQKFNFLMDWNRVNGIDFLKEKRHSGIWKSINRVSKSYDKNALGREHSSPRLGTGENWMTNRGKPSRSLG
ncbi:hypothetical protein IFM89_013074, partial [Coptis chinensis]